MEFSPSKFYAGKNRQKNIFLTGIGVFVSSILSSILVPPFYSVKKIEIPSSSLLAQEPGAYQSAYECVVPKSKFAEHRILNDPKIPLFPTILIQFVQYYFLQKMMKWELKFLQYFDPNKNPIPSPSDILNSDFKIGTAFGNFYLSSKKRDEILFGSMFSHSTFQNWFSVQEDEENYHFLIGSGINSSKTTPLSSVAISFYQFYSRYLLLNSVRKFKKTKQ